MSMKRTKERVVADRDRRIRRNQYLLTAMECVKSVAGGKKLLTTERGLEQRDDWSRGTSAPARVPPRERTAAGRGAC